MTMWIAVLLACVACFALKFVGYLVPESWVSGGRTSRITTLLPVALLAGLLAVQTLVGSGGSLVIDARVGAIAVAIVLLLRAPTSSSSCSPRRSSRACCGRWV